MNWAAWAPAIVTVIAAVFTYGRYSQTQTEHAKRLDDVDDRLDGHGEHLSRVDLALVRLEEYNRGFTDASRLKRN